MQLINCIQNQWSSWVFFQNGQFLNLLFLLNLLLVCNISLNFKYTLSMIWELKSKANPVVGKGLAERQYVQQFPWGAASSVLYRTTQESHNTGHIDIPMGLYCMYTPGNQFLSLCLLLSTFSCSSNQHQPPSTKGKSQNLPIISTL